MRKNVNIKKKVDVIFFILICICVLLGLGMVAAVTFAVLDPIVSNLIESDALRVVVLTGICLLVVLIILMAVPLSSHGYYRYLRLKDRNGNLPE